MILNASINKKKSLEEDTALPIYGEVIELSSSDEFLQQIDKTDSRTTIVVHLYDPQIRVEFF